MVLHRRGFVALVFAAAAASSGCYNIRPSTGGGQTTFSGARAINPADIAVLNGYRAAAVASGFTYPTGVAFDGDGRPHVTESGYSYGEDFTAPRLVRVNADGSKKTVITGDETVPGLASPLRTALSVSPKGVNWRAAASCA